MAYRVAIDSGSGGTNNGILEKDYVQLISNYIHKRLDTLGIENFLVENADETLSDQERVNIIKEKYGNGNNVIVISNRLNKGNEDGAEIMYALRNNSRLASSIATSLEDAGQNVIKYYQLRDSNNTALDGDYIIRNTANNQALAIYYGYNNSNGDDVNLIKNNYEDLAEAVVKAIAGYAGVTYYPINGSEYYVVKKGDSLWSIANVNNTTIDNIKKLNKLSSNNLMIGQLLKLTGSITNDKEDEDIYVVKNGDSLYLIAKKYNTTIDELKRTNNLVNDALSIGQKLVIPKESGTNQISYVVQKGDSLWSISNKYDTTVDKLKSTNNLTSNALSIGQKLVIPSTTKYVTYNVQNGDSLYKIAKKYNTTVDSIIQLNNLKTNNLAIGQKLLITA